jgi:NADPH:quinone reductase-like Zn-dependent oxidoreductase
MRAATVDRYGPPEVVRVVEVDHPGPPKADQVVVRVVASPVTSGDARIRGARFPPGFAVPARLALGIRGPRRRILGNPFAGVVEQTGAAVTHVSVGDRVCGMTGVHMGTHAELVLARAAKVVGIPDEVSHEQAAGVLFGGTTALHFLRDKAEVIRGTTVLVNGASGAVGTAAVQIANDLGATVTAVTSGRNAELVRSLGAERIVDHTTTPITEVRQRFDVVFDTVGNLTPATGRALLNDDGLLLLAVAGLWDTIRPRSQVRTGTSRERADDFTTLLGMVADGRLQVVLEDVLDLDRIVEAHRRVDSGRKVGNLLIRP